MMTFLLTLTLVAQSGTQTAAPKRLTDETFLAIKQHASLTNRDLLFQTVDWHPSVFNGVNAARISDKPILMWLYFGDPRGHC